MRKHHPTNLLNEMLEGNMTLLTSFARIEFLLDSAVYLQSLLFRKRISIIPPSKEMVS